MQGYNLLIAFNVDKNKVLMCKRRKPPYQGMINFPGGKIEKGEAGLEGAYRELWEETGITKEDIVLTHLMDFTYYLSDCYLEVYVGRLNKDREVFGEENELFWSEIDCDFFDTKKYAGEGNIGHKQIYWNYKYKTWEGWIMFHISNFTNNDDINVLDSMGPFTVIEYARDLSVAPTNAMAAYFCNAMNVRKRQVMCDLSQANVTVQSGAMQWMVGNVKATTGIKGVGDLLGKAVRGKVTGESAIKPEYTGDGVMVLEPTYKHIILLDVDDWNGSVVLDDGMFLACDANLRHKAVMRSTLSSAAAGNEGLFNLGIVGSGVLCLESPCPKEELVEVTLRDDVIKIDGNMAVAWSGSLDFTVERSGRSLMGSAVSGEGLVNVYRGTGKVLFAPVR